MATYKNVTILSAQPELTRQQFKSLLSCVSPQKRERIERISAYRDAQNCLLGDILARCKISHITRVDIQKLDFSVNDYGKPYLTDNPDIHFNISHSGQYVALSVASKPVGIDIETIKPFKHGVVKRFFSPDEITYIETAEESEQKRRFFEVWTKKESRIKWEGTGLSKPLPSFSVFDTDDTAQPVYHKVFYNDEAICHVCINEKSAPKVEIIGTKELHGLI